MVSLDSEQYQSEVVACTYTSSPGTFECIEVLVLGSFANSFIGGLTGLVGALLVFSYDEKIIETIMSMGICAGFIGGLLHAIVVLGDHTTQKSSNEKGEGSFGSLCLRVFTQAPCWSAIGSAISFWFMKDFSDIPFVMVLLSGLSGTIFLAICALTLSCLTGSRRYLWILKNQVIVLADRLHLLNPQNQMIIIIEPQDCESGATKGLAFEESPI